MLVEAANFFFFWGGGRVGASVKVGVSLLHRHRAISWHAFWVAWLNSRGKGGGRGWSRVVLKSLGCARL